MEYCNYFLEQLFENKSYEGICNYFLSLADDDIKPKLESILYKGGYENYACNSGLSNHDNPDIEIKRRVSLANLLINNPDTFDILVQNNVNLFHGTNGNALPSIIVNGLNSFNNLQEMGIDVTTGETWSQKFGSRKFISMTDVLDIAEDYSSFASHNGDRDLSFEVVIGCCKDDIDNSSYLLIDSDVPEIGIKSHIDISQIKVIMVPAYKVEFVKKLLSGKDIIVCPLDTLTKKLYYINDLYHIDILKDNQDDAPDRFNYLIDEIQSIAESRTLTSIKDVLNRFKSIFMGKERVQNGNRKL